MLMKKHVTLWGNLKQRLRGKYPQFLTPSSRIRFFNRENTATFMNTLHKERYNCYDTTESNLIMRLWMLRLLIPLECHRKFIDSQGRIQHDGLAAFLGLPGEHFSDSENPVTGKSSTHSSSKENAVNAVKSQSQQQPLSPLPYLQRWHQEAEQHYGKPNLQCLPQPLANNIQQLATQIGLSEVESWLLAFTVLLHSERLLNEVSNWLGRELNSLNVTHALSVILNFPEAEIRAALSSQSVLSKTALVVIGRFGQDDLRRKLELLSHRFADHLRSETGSPVDWLRDRIISSQPPQLSLNDFPHLQESLDLLLPFLKQVLTTRKTGVNILLYGPPGTGKTQLTRVLANTLNCALYEITCEDEDGDPVQGRDRLSAFRAAQAFFQHQASLILFDEVDDVFDDGDGLFGKKSTAQTRKAWMNRLLEENPVPTFWLSNHIDSIDPAFIRRFDWVLAMPIPPKSQRERIIRQHCASILTDSTIQQLANCEALAPAVITRAANVVKSLLGQFPAEQLSTTLQQLMNNTLIAQGYAGLAADKSNPLPDYYDLTFINCDTDLNQLMIGIQHHGSARLCLYGLPGTGKTAYAYWLAKQLDQPLQVRRGADILSQWVGGTEKNLARIFKDAEHEQAILLIDEIEGFLQPRHDNQRIWEVTIVNELLMQLEQHQGVFIATTNRLEAIETAALRRFDLKIQFHPLKFEQAWQLLQRYCQVLGLSEPDQYLQSALQKLEGLTAGDFAMLQRQHCFRPLKDARALIEALQEECVLKRLNQSKPIGFI